MKNDRYFPLEICFWAGDNLSVMIYQIGGVQLVGIYVLLLYLCAKNDYSKSVVNSMQKPVEKSAVEKNSETPMDKGQKPNETQESRVEEKRNITTVVNNSSNIGEERKTAAVVVRTSDSVNDRGNEIVSPRLDPVQSTSCFCSAHGLSLLVPRVSTASPRLAEIAPRFAEIALRPAEIFIRGSYFRASFSLVIAFSGSFSSSSRVTNLLPMIAPEACSQAAWNVALLEIPNPTINGLFRCIPSIFLK